MSKARDLADSVAAGSVLADGVVSVSEITSASGADLNFVDNSKAIFGAGSDLQIYHDGNHSYISDQGTGNLRILAESFNLRNPANNESMIIATPNSGVTLYYDSAQKFTTTSTGIGVTGTVAADGLIMNGAQPTDVSIQLTTSGDGWTIGTAYNANNDIDLVFKGGNAGSAFTEYLRITDAGNLDVNGTVTADGLTVDGAYPEIVLNDTRNTNTWDNGDVLGQITFTTDDVTTSNPIAAIKAVHNRAGTGHSANDAGLEFYASATTTGTIARRLSITSNTGDISFYEDTGTTAKFVWDSSDESLLLSKSSGLALQVGTNDGTLAGAEFRYSTVPAYITNSVASSPTTGHATFSINQYDNTEGTADSWSSPSNASYNSAAVQLTSTTDGSEIRFFTEAGEAGIDQKMVIDSAGNVGIGTDSPTYLLHVQAVTNSQGAAYIQNNAGSAWGLEIGIHSAASESDLVLTGNAVIGSQSSLSFVAEDTGYFRWMTGGTSHKTGTVGATERVRIDADGIKFNGDTDAANALDDYEEGTWTVTAYDSAGGGNASPTTTTGYYTKIGNIVRMYFQIINIDTTGMTAGNLVYITLPFATGSVPSIGQAVLNNTSYNGRTNPYAYIPTNYSRFRLQVQSESTTIDIVEVGWLSSGTTDMYVNMTYEV